MLNALPCWGENESWSPPEKGGLASTNIIGGPGARLRSRSLGAVVPAACSQPAVIHLLDCDSLAQWAIRTIFSCTRVLVLGWKGRSGIRGGYGFALRTARPARGTSMDLNLEVPRSSGPARIWSPQEMNFLLLHASSFSGGNCYSTTIILFGSESGIHRRPRASRVMLRTEEFLTGMGNTVNFCVAGSKRTSLFAFSALSSYQILPVESTVMPYGSESLPDGLCQNWNFLSARVRRPRRPPPKSVK